jgi:peptide chain release factor 2
MKKLAAVKAPVEMWAKIAADLSDMETLETLAAEEKDEIALAQVAAEGEALARRMRSFEIQTKLSGESDLLNAIVSIHAGAGGTESCDWADMLLRMYMRWAERRGFKVTITDILGGDEAGIKSVTFIVEGDYAYGLMQSEIGVHRLVRVSPFDANKRRHTSFASVDVIPEVEDPPEIKVEEKDIRLDTYRASGAGGQHVNKTDSAVRITHFPSGVVVQCQTERSQIKNRELAFKLLKARLYEFELEKRRAKQEKHYDDKGDIAWGSQIRSYVFMPYQMVKDHRTDAQSPRVELVMDGEIDQFIESYLAWKVGRGG